METPTVSKLLTGKVKTLGVEGAKDPMERPWESGMFKQEKNGPVWLSKTGLKGDEVADKKNHGGPEKALFVYPAAHYEYWQQDLEIDSIGIGAMGENIALVGGDEFTFCIGDTYQLGEAVIQVSQPRRPCWKPARRFKVLDFTLRIQNTGRTGWYFRVLQEGHIEAGDEFVLLERPYPQWTIAASNEVMYVKTDDLRLADELASCELLAVNWKRSLFRRLRGQKENIKRRVYGPNVE